MKFLCFCLVSAYIVSLVDSFAYLMTCDKWPNMCTLGGSIGLMGSCGWTYSISELDLKNVKMIDSSHGTYTPESTVTLSLFPHTMGSEIVFQASGGAVFNGSMGSRVNDYYFYLLTPLFLFRYPTCPFQV